MTDLFRRDLAVLRRIGDGCLRLRSQPDAEEAERDDCGSSRTCQVLMEERMACGMGACLGCTIEVLTPSGVEYRQVCVDGPVFDLRSIVWR